jgi:hypothetical protein
MKRQPHVARAVRSRAEYENGLAADRRCARPIEYVHLVHAHVDEVARRKRVEQRKGLPVVEGNRQRGTTHRHCLGMVGRMVEVHSIADADTIERHFESALRNAWDGDRTPYRSIGEKGQLHAVV